MKKSLFLTFILLLNCNLSYADGFDEDEDEDQSTDPTKDLNVVNGTPNLFTDCGIGAILFPSVTWAAAISNFIWDYGLTATTSAVSTPTSCRGDNVEMAKFIIETLPELEKDIAMGGGDYMDAIASIADCKQDYQSQLSENIKNTYYQYTNSAEYSQNNQVQQSFNMYWSIKSAVNNSQGQCQIVL